MPLICSYFKTTIAMFYKTKPRVVRAARFVSDAPIPVGINGVHTFDGILKGWVYDKAANLISIEEGDYIVYTESNHYEVYKAEQFAATFDVVNDPITHL